MAARLERARRLASVQSGLPHRSKRARSSICISPSKGLIRTAMPSETAVEMPETTRGKATCIPGRGELQRGCTVALEGSA